MKRTTKLLLALLLVLAFVPAIALAETTYEYSATASLADTSKKYYDQDTLTDADFKIVVKETEIVDGQKQPARTMAPTEYTVTVPFPVELADDQLEATNTVTIQIKKGGTDLIATKYVKVKVYRKLTGFAPKTYPQSAQVGQYLSNLPTPTFTASFATGDDVVVEADKLSIDKFTAQGTIEVTATYSLGGITKTAVFQIEVLPDPASLVKISKLVVEECPTEVYIDSDTSANVKIVAEYTDGTTKDVTSECVFTPATYTATGTGNAKAEYTFNGDTAVVTLTPTVKEYLTKLTLTYVNDKPYVDDEPEFTAVATFADGSEQDVTSKVEVTTPASGKYAASDTKLEVSYKHSAHGAAKTTSKPVTPKTAPTLDVALSTTVKANITAGKKILVGDPMRDLFDNPVFTVKFDGSTTDADGNDYADLCTIEPNTKYFTKPGMQLFTFKYSDPETGKAYTSKFEVEVFEPVADFFVDGEPTQNYAGEIFDPEVMPGLNYSVVYSTSAVTGQAAGTHIIKSTNWAHERIKWTPNLKLAFGDKNNEVKFSYTDPMMSNALYVTKTISGRSVVNAVTVSGSPKFFIGETFRDDLLRSIDKLGVTITIDYVEGYGDDYVIKSSTDKMLSRINIPNISLEKGSYGDAHLVYTDTATGSITKSDAISYNAQPMGYYTTGKTTAPQWTGNFNKTSYSEGQAFSTSGVKLVMTNFWGEKETVASGFTYDIRTKATKTTAATFKAEDKETTRLLKATDDRVRLHYVYRGLDGAEYDAFSTAYKKSTGKKGIMYTNISVTKRVLSKIQITEQPDKLSYEIGETFDTTGMVVTAIYGNGTKENVTTYTFEPTTAFKKADVGSYKVVITYQDGTVKKTANVAVVVNGPAVPSQSVVLNKAMINLVETESEKLTATVYPKTASNKNVSWSSSDVTVATVSDDGTVKAVGAGSCLITATTLDYTHRYADCYVEVEPKTAVTKLKLNHSSLDLLLGDTTTLKCTITPENATATEIEWESSNETIVSVNENGQIKGLKAGEAIISASVDGMTVKCAVTVVKELEHTGTVYNCTKSVNVRKSASTSAEVIGSAAKGNKYKVLGQSSDGKWYKIQYTSSKVGYIHKDYLKVVTRNYTADSSENANNNSNSGSSTTIIATKLTIVNCQRYCYVRKGPSTSTSSLGHATVNSTYTLLGVSGDWYIINYDGQQGYVNASFAKIS